MLVQKDVIIIGSDRGEVKLLDKINNFMELANVICMDDPVIKLEMQMYALFAQHKDVNGTISIIKVSRSGMDQWSLTAVGKVETMNASFAGFTSTIMR